MVKKTIWGLRKLCNSCWSRKPILSTSSFRKLKFYLCFNGIWDNIFSQTGNELEASFLMFFPYTSCLAGQKTDQKFGLWCLHCDVIQIVPRIVAFIAVVNCKWNYYSLCVNRSSLSACVWGRRPANGLGLNFLVNSKSKWFGQSKRKGKKWGLISLFMNVTIPDTHGSCSKLFDLHEVCLDHSRYR